MFIQQGRWVNAFWKPEQILCEVEVSKGRRMIYRCYWQKENKIIINTSNNEAYWNKARNNAEAIMNAEQHGSNNEARWNNAEAERGTQSYNKAYRNNVEVIMKPTRLLSAIVCAWEVSLEKLSLQRLIHCRQCKGGLSLPEQNELVVSGNPQTPVPHHGNAVWTSSVHRRN